MYTYTGVPSIGDVVLSPVRQRILRIWFSLVFFLCFKMTFGKNSEERHLKWGLPATSVSFLNRRFVS